MPDSTDFHFARALFAGITTDIPGYQRFNEALPVLDGLAAHYASLSEDEQAKARDTLLAQSPESFFGRVAQLSFVSNLVTDPALMRALGTAPDFSSVAAQCQYFLLWQVLARGFHRPGSVDGETNAAMQRVYRTLVRRYTRELGLELPFIPPEQRDWNTVFLVTPQFLAPHLHAPTADVLDYAGRLAAMGKRPIILNSALLPRTVAAPFYKPLVGQYFAGYETARAIPYGNGQIAFHQCAPLMPDPDEIHNMVRSIHAARPGYVLSMGHSNLLADICGAFTTTVGFPFSTEFQITAATSYVLPRQWRDGDEAIAASLRLIRDRVLPSDYKFTLPAGGPPLQRAQLDLPDNSIAIAIIGNRLDKEATAGWIAELAAQLERNRDAVLLFIGSFESYGRHCEAHPVLARQSRSLGFVADAPALLHAVDLYLNPPRVGGGSSAAHALACGVPVLTDPSGDVANVAGPMALPGLSRLDETLAKWRSDMAWRTQQQDAARERWKSVSDRDGLLQAIETLARQHADVRAPVFSSDD